MFIEYVTMKRGSRMYIYVIWIAITIFFAHHFVSVSGSGASSVSSYFSTSANHSNDSCPKNCSEVVFELLPIGLNFEHVEIYLLVTLFILIAILAKLMWHLAKFEKFTSNFPESCMLIIIGIIFGLVLGCYTICEFLYVTLLNYCVQWCSPNSKSHFARNLLANRRTCYKRNKININCSLGDRKKLANRAILLFEQLLLGEHYCIRFFIMSTFWVLFMF